MSAVNKRQLAWINDFMSNGYEHCGDDEARDFLINDIGLDALTAERVMGFSHQFSTCPRFELYSLELKPRLIPQRLPIQR